MADEFDHKAEIQIFRRDTGRHVVNKFYDTMSEAQTYLNAFNRELLSEYRLMVRRNDIEYQYMRLP